jgi:hypothetical protein
MNAFHCIPESLDACEREARSAGFFDQAVRFQEYAAESRARATTVVSWRGHAGRWSLAGDRDAS